ncbi:nucleotidyl transferase AbiEii/AbiGii toxin family protein [Fusibacter sp. 3D3]|uniref:nucleotidyl transferase AbiEii/AbiGii toxin family protein n=1 Tax=Fusibacter sp. 3D3 TaxID=1048380 RepID=UPI000853CC8C|nr:nucleotidyl transferase AbiEii/AbiGii toxin family protein [Fusibacter sp. 3D3]GAU75827.1 abortive infection protein AbiGII [Fusibacter sp. 3D3]
MKSATQLKAQIRNLSKKNAINPQILMRNYMLERLLERISHSNFKDNFILKGGMLVAAMVGVDLRATIDMDTTVKGMPLEKETIARIFQEIIQINLEDNVFMTLKDIEEIREEADYPGLRVSLVATMGTAKIPLKVDITTGDKITPREIIYSYKLMIENRMIDVLAYNLETVLAEKLETIITRGIVNTRMRDFYDLFILINVFTDHFSYSLLKEAVKMTSERRGTAEELKKAFIVFDQIENDKDMAGLWMRYQNSFSYAKDIEWISIIPVVRKVWDSIIDE